jgi:hypothetical protein
MKRKPKTSTIINANNKKENILMNMNEQFELAEKLISGAGVQRDEDEAVRLLTSAGHAGHVKAQALLGSMLRNCGKIDEAKTWLGKAADSGDTGAQVELGMVCVSSGGPHADYNKAHECWKAAARAGTGMAFANLGMLYANGLGVKRSPTKAVLLATTAVFAGNQEASTLVKDFTPLLKQSSPNAIRQMKESLSKLESLAATGDKNTVCCWMIDNLNSLE